MEDFQRVEVRADRVGPFEVEDGGGRPVPPGRGQIRDAPHHAELPTGRPLKPEQPRHHRERG